jgi:hypothetical protein
MKMEQQPEMGKLFNLPQTIGIGACWREHNLTPGRLDQAGLARNGKFLFERGFDITDWCELHGGDSRKKADRAQGKS